MNINSPPKFSGMSHSAQELWAKSGEGICHSLIAHLFDVAAVCEEIMRIEPSSSILWASKQFGLPIHQTVRWLASLSGLHDFGKGIPGFQAKWPEGMQADLRSGLNFPSSACGREKHDLATAALLDQALKAFVDANASWLRHVSRAVGAHHGYHFLSAEIQEGKPLNEPPLWRAARGEILQCYWQTLKPQGRPETDELSLTAVNWLAGLTSVADWIASNPDWFPLGNRGFDDLSDYHTHSLQLARTALEQIGWRPYLPLLRDSQATNELISRIVGGDQISAFELQVTGDRLLVSAQGPSLLLVEAPMGEGKTELAFLAHLRLQLANGHRGLYVALPTQATGNALFKRALTFLEQFRSGPMDVQLVHGGAVMDEDMLRMRAVYLRGVAHSAHESLEASTWFSQRKRPLLSAYGVGTIDQALFAVLNVKHHFVRLWGLSNRVVVLDEVHAYDTYTSGLIAALLRWLRAMDCSVVLMSATLPHARRIELLAAWGVDKEEIPELVYPRVILADRHSVRGEHFKARDLSPIRIYGLGESIESMADKAVGLLSGGGCGALIVNTVDRAQKLYTMLRNRLGSTVPLLLFHARFPAEERAAREREVLAAFGAKGDRPPRALMIATQVAEQSLDIDFDFMLSDLAPIDLLLQRAGRLHRHTRSRPAQHAQPRFWVAGLQHGAMPQLKETAWGYIYDAYILLRTWALLSEEVEVRLPQDIDRLVQAVYGDEPLPENIERDIWNRIEIESLGEYLARVRKERQESLNIAIDPREEPHLAYNNKPRGNEEGEGLGLENKTRLGRESITLIPVMVEGGQWSVSRGLPFFDPAQALDEPTAQQLYKRRLTVSRKGVVEYFNAQPLPAAFEHPLLRNCHPLPLVEGHFLEAGFSIHLDTRLGLVIREGGGANLPLLSNPANAGSDQLDK